MDGTRPTSKTQGDLIMVLLMLLLAVSAYSAFGPVRTKAAIPWEYRIEAVPDESFAERTSSLGAQGWELVFARRATTSSVASVSREEEPVFAYEMIFKRPRRPGSPP